MARHHFINNDLELFLNADAEEFKKKISKRVFLPWQSSLDENDLIFLHMILARVITDHQLKSSVIHDWKTIFEKLTASGYKFTSEDYFPDVHGRHLYIEPAIASGIHSYFDMLNEPQYLEMIKELHASGVAIDEAELHKSLKKYGDVSKIVTDFFSSVGFNLDTVLTEISVDNEIKSLTKSGYDASLLNLDNAQKGISKKLDDYKKEQALKSDRIKDYLNTHEISPERANELYKCFSVSYEKMETYPEFKGRYLADICCFYYCANELKTEAFFMDVQVDLIKLLEAKTNIKFLQDHAVGSHRRIGETAGKKNHWEL